MSFYDPIPNPGMLTDQEAASDSGRQDPRWQKAHGYDWLAFQVYNGSTGGKKTRSLKSTKDAGMHAGVWGAFFDQATFYADGKAFAEQAITVGAEFLIVDAEDCSKFTRATRGCLPIIQGVRAGGWTGPVHWTQMGCPTNARTAANPTGNDYQCDERSFLDTGGGVLPQEYANEDASFAPALALPYWLACGVPAWRLNHSIAVYEGHAGRIDGAGWALLLQAAKIGRNFSIYMAEMLQPYDAEGLDAQTKLPAPTPLPPPAPPLVDPAVCNANIVREADRWLTQYTPGSKPLSRLQIIRRVAASSDAGWTSVDRLALKALLDKAGL